MTSKLPQEKNSHEYFQIMVQICVVDQNVERKKPMLRS